MNQDHSPSEDIAGSDAEQVAGHKNVIRELVAYAFVGFASNGLSYLVYLILTHFGLLPALSMTIVYVVALTIAYFGNRSITFSYTGSTKISVIKFFLVYVIGYLINLGLLLIFNTYLGYPHQLVMLVNIFIVAVFLFIAMRYFVFPADRLPTYPSTESDESSA